MSGAISAGTLIAAGIGAGGSIGSALIGAHSAGSAADAQMAAANKAAQLQGQGSTNALNYENGIYGQTEQNLAPWIQSGGGANNMLSYLLGISPNTSIGQSVQGAQPLNLNPSTPRSGPATGVPQMGTAASSLSPQSGATPGASGLTPTGSPAMPIGRPMPGAALGIQGINQLTPSLTSSASPSGATPGFGSLTQGYGKTFENPQLNESTDPGYQARLQLGTDAIERSAAARGGVLTGGTAKALDQFGQDYASNEYNNVYNRALNNFNTNYGVWNNDNNNIYNRLMGLSGAGQNASTALGSLGQASANNVTQNLLGTGAQIGQDYNNAGAANASGIVGAGNAWSNGLTGATSGLSQLLMLKQLGLAGGGNPYASQSGGPLPTGWA